MTTGPLSTAVPRVSDARPQCLTFQGRAGHQGMSPRVFQKRRRPMRTSRHAQAAVRPEGQAPAPRAETPSIVRGWRGGGPGRALCPLQPGQRPPRSLRFPAAAGAADSRRPVWRLPRGGCGLGRWRHRASQRLASRRLRQRPRLKGSRRVGGSAGGAAGWATGAAAPRREPALCAALTLSLGGIATGGRPKFSLVFLWTNVFVFEMGLRPLS